MTDRFNALIVVLADDLRDDDAQPLIDAISLFRGVVHVGGHVSSVGDVIAEQRALAKFREKIVALAFPESQP